MMNSGNGLSNIQNCSGLKFGIIQISFHPKKVTMSLIKLWIWMQSLNGLMSLDLILPRIYCGADVLIKLPL